MGSSVIRIAWRNLGRNKRRTGLALAAIGLGQMFVVCINGLTAGMFQEMLTTITGPMIGHVQVHHPDWAEERAIDLYVENLEAATRAIKAVPGVTSVSPRILSAVLAASGVKTGQPATAEPAMVIGLDVEVESQTDGILEFLSNDEYPSEKGVAMGKVLAKKLGLKVGDEVAIIGQDAEEFPVSDLFTVTALVGGNVDIVKRMGIILPLDTAQEFFALQDRAHEIVIGGEDHREADILAASIRDIESLKGAKVLPWDEVNPLFGMIMGVKFWYDLIFVGILFVAAAAGIANTMMMSTFERSHEFGMLLALGTTPNRIVSMIMVEAVVLGISGVVLGSIAGTIAVLITGYTGIDYMAFAAPGIDIEDMSFQGLNISLVIYPIFEFHNIIYGAIAVSLTSVAVSIWPARAASRLQPTEAMRA